MRFQSPLVWVPVVVASAASAYTPAQTWGTDILAARGLQNLAISLIEAAQEGTGSCTLRDISVRREW